MNIFLFHRDLRLIDNTALIAQLKTLKQKVIPAFIFTSEQVKPEVNRYFSSNSVQFMVESLQDLNKQVS
jgi:deoxyribodipyrimidine photolyase